MEELWRQISEGVRRALKAEDQATHSQPNVTAQSAAHPKQVLAFVLRYVRSTRLPAEAARQLFEQVGCKRGMLPGWVGRCKLPLLVLG